MSSSKRNYAFYSHRLQSFEGAPLSGTGTRKQRVQKLLPWPHPIPNDETPVRARFPSPRLLAFAGFFFSPEEGSPDRVECFCCKRGLGSWEEGDNPFEEHYTRAEKARDCAWAVSRCAIERYKRYKKDRKTFSWKFPEDVTPAVSSEYEARLETFDGWPFDTVKGAACNSKALASAGFIYTPEANKEDDAVTCFYCDRSLSGWQPDDDPIENHRRGEKAHDCAFLKAYDQSHPAKPKGRSTRTIPSQSSSSSKQRSPFLVSSAPLSRAASGQYASEADLPVKKLATKKSSRLIHSELDQRDATTTDAGEATDEVPVPAKKGRAVKKTKPASRAVSVAPSESEIDTNAGPSKKKKTTKAAPVEAAVSSDEDTPPPPPKSKAAAKKTTKSKAKPVVVASDDDEDDALALPPKSTRKPSSRASVARAPSRASRQPIADEESSDDELKLSDARPRNARSRSVSQAPSTTKTPGAKGKAASAAALSRSTRASSRALASEDDPSSEDVRTRGGRVVSSSRGRKTITSSSSKGLPDPEATPSAKSSQSKVKRSTRSSSQVITASEPEALDIDQLVEQAAQRYNAKHGTSDAESQPRALSKSTRTRGAPVASDVEPESDVYASQQENESDARGKRVVRGGHGRTTGTSLSTKAKKAERSASASVKRELAASVSSLSVPTHHDRGDRDPDSADDVGTDMQDEITPQPIRTQSNSNSSGSAPISRPNFSQESAAPAPAERAPVNGWRELASTSKTPKPPSSSATSALRALSKVPSRDASASQNSHRETSPDTAEAPRVVAPLRKPKARSPQVTSPPTSSFQSRLKPPSVVNSPQVKIEADESVVMISPPRPQRSPSRIPAPVPSRSTTPTPRTIPTPAQTSFERSLPLQERQPSRAPSQQPNPAKSAKSQGKEKAHEDTSSQRVADDEMDLDDLTPHPPPPARLATKEPQRGDIEMREPSSQPTMIRATVLAPKDPPLAAPAEIETLPSFQSIPTLSAAPSLTPTQLTDVASTLGPLTSLLTSDQLSMTLEEFIRAETQTKYTAMKVESEKLLNELMEEGKRKRKLLIEHLRRAPTTA